LADLVTSTLFSRNAILCFHFRPLHMDHLISETALPASYFHYLNTSFNYIQPAITLIDVEFCTDGVFFLTILTINSNYFHKYY